MDKQLARDLIDELRDIRAVLQLVHRDQLLEAKEKIFGDDPDQKEAYRLFCAGHSYREIGQAVNVSHTSVGRWVETWRSHGLVHPNEKRCVVTPDVLGL